MTLSELGWNEHFASPYAAWQDKPDVRPGRVGLIAANIERLGLTDAVAVVVQDGRHPALRPGTFDHVLVDAPCSGLGTLRRNPEARWRLTPAALATFPARQLALLVTYAPLCAVGGRLVYATCTILEDENEKVIERFLAERSDFVRVPVKEVWGKPLAEKVGDGLSLRLFPHRHDTDGFYAAILRRVG